MNDIEQQYRNRYDAVLKPLAAAIEEQLREYLQGELRIDRVSARAKDVDRFVKKAKARVNDEPKYSEPLSQIQDQVGARIITFYRSDVERLDAFVKKYYRPIEYQDHVPEREWEFGYFGRHYVLLIPSDVITAEMDKGLIPRFFELQIKTLFQHAWSEAEHDLGYKPGATPLTTDQKRRLAFTSAQAWGADRVFEELFQERGDEGTLRVNSSRC